MTKKQKTMTIILIILLASVVVVVTLSIQKSMKYYYRTPAEYSGAIPETTAIVECNKKANDTEIRTARIDQYQAGEEAFFSCLISKGMDPYKNKWRDREPSNKTLIYIKNMLNLNEKRDKKEFLIIHQMKISYSEAEFLKERYHATAIFTPTKEERVKALTLYENAINTAKYGYTAADYQVQYIGMMVNGKKMIYAHAWSNGYNDTFDPEKDFVSIKVKDGGESFIDAEIDFTEGTIIISPHGES